MKTAIVLLCSFFCFTTIIYGQFVEHTAVYGQVQTDINRGYRIRLMPDSNFIIAGQWNNQAYLIKVDCAGNTLATRLFGNEIAGISSFDDVQQLPDSSWVAVGTCDHCMPNDTTAKAVLLKVDSDLNYDAATGVTMLGKSARYQQFTASTHNDPKLLIDGQNLVLVTGFGFLGALNASDFMLTKLNFNLDTLSTRLFSHQYFDAPAAIFKNPGGYKVVANHAFVSGAATIQIDNTGNVLWTNIGLSDVVAYSAVVLTNGNVLVCGTRTNAGVWVGEFNGSDGAFTGNEISFNGERATDIKLLPNGNALLTAWFPLFSGARSTRIYRLQTHPLQVIGAYDLVPNPDAITNMGSQSIVPISEDGTSFVTTGVRGFYNRTFFHTKRDCNTLTTPGQFTATLCSGAFIKIGATVFDENNPVGTGVLPGAAACGCDSTVEVALNFYPASESDFKPTLCVGDSVIVSGLSFDANHQTGDVVLAGQSINGCDSTVHVALSFYPSATAFITDTLTFGESLVIGNTVFSMANPSGTVFLENASYTGCDSIVEVHLTFVTAVKSSPFVAGEIRVMPNPMGSGNTFLIQYTSATTENLTFTCYDLAGRLIWEKMCDLPDHTDTPALPAPEQAGMYWLTISDRNGHYATFRLVVL